MKFYCDKCQTKYSIADEKVVGKVLKVRCKKCSHVITVREPTAPLKSAAPSAPASQGRTPPPAPGRVQWYYSVNGETIGPFPLHVLQRMFARGELGDAVYVWNESFTGWKPVFEVTEFRASLEKALKVRPRAQTLGISQALEAINIDDHRIQANAAATKTIEEEREPFEVKADPLAKSSEMVDSAVAQEAVDKLDTLVEGDEPAITETVAETVGKAVEVDKEPSKTLEAPKKPLPGLFKKGPRTPGQGAVEAPQATGRSERLERLRKSLRNSDEIAAPSRETESAPAAVLPAPALPAPALPAPALPAPGLPAAALPGAHPLDEVDVALGDTVEAGKGPSSQPASPDASAELEALSTASVHDGLFSGQASAELAEEDPLNEEEVEEEGDKVPFFPAAPRLESQGGPAAQSRSEQISGSLLLQLNSIKKQGRGKTLAGGVIVLLLIGGLIGTAVYLGGQKPEAEEQEAPRMIAGVETSEPVFNRDKKEDPERLQNQVQLEDGVTTVEEGETFVEEEEGDLEKQAAVVRSKGSAPSRVPQVAPVDDFEAAMDGATAAAAPSVGLARTEAPGGAVRIEGDRGARVAAPSDTLTNEDRFNAMAAAQTGVGSAPIYRPTESMERRQQAAVSAPSGLTAEQAQEGMQDVRRSIGLCRERHMRRGGTIEARKIYVTVEVQTTGRVTSFSVEPDAVRDTEFDRCMQSHMGRWNFSSFSGEAVMFRAPIVLN